MMLDQPQTWSVADADLLSMGHSTLAMTADTFGHLFASHGDA